MPPVQGADSLGRLYNQIFKARRSRSAFESHVSRSMDVTWMVKAWHTRYRECCDRVEAASRARGAWPETFPARRALHDYMFFRLKISDPSVRTATWGELDARVCEIGQRADDVFRVPPPACEGSGSGIHPVELHELAMRSGGAGLGLGWKG